MGEPEFRPPLEDHSVTLGRRSSTPEAPRIESKEWSSVLKTLDLNELLDLRNQIENLLPASRLGDINLERELVLQLRAHQELQAAVINDETASPSHRAQVANSTRASLEALVKLQDSVYRSERFKTVERILIQCLNELPLETVNLFLEKYEQEIEAHG